MRRELKDTNRVRRKLAKLPKICAIFVWYGCGYREYPFVGCDKDGMPLVYDFDDCNGMYPHYELFRLNQVSTGTLLCWTKDRNKAIFISSVIDERVRKKK